MQPDNLVYLQTTLSRIDTLIHLAVERAQQSAHGPTDALRGLVVSDDEIDDLMKQTPMAGLWQGDTSWQLDLSIPDGMKPDLPFLRLVDGFGLSLLDAYILILSLAPELDRRYERVYAYLQDDMTQRRVTLNLLMNLLGDTLAQRFTVWGRLKPEMPLVKYRLLSLIPNPDKPNAASLSNLVRVEGRVVDYLLGTNTPDPRVRDAILPNPIDHVITLSKHAFDGLAARMADNPIVFMKGKRERGQASTAAALLVPFDMPMVRINAERLNKPDVAFDEMWRFAIREGYLNNAALMIEGWENLLDNQTKQPSQPLWEALSEYPKPVFICSEKDWEPLDPWRRRPMLRVTVDLPDFPERLAAWEQFAAEVNLPADRTMLEPLAQKFRLSREQIARAVRSAVDFSLSHNEGFRVDDLYAGVQAHISLQLGHLAERIVPRYRWDDLILPDDQLQQLHEIVDRARLAYRVQTEWGFYRRIPNAAGVSALFAGESGTGKTLSVHVIADALGLALYRIDLSAVVSKYIGETEKNLSVIFAEARASNAILFFDEADAIFGKRSEVKDARDRYANIEIAYLLQQIEDYDGVAIMATNLRQNLDEAFTRRLDFMVDFPFPDAYYRHQLWQAHFPDEAPISADVDLERFADRYPMSGGNIRNAALASAFLAAADGGVITPEHVRNAVRREHQKMGRLIEEF